MNHNNQEEEKYILHFNTEEGQTTHLIDRVYHMGCYHFFSIVDLCTFEVMFGQFLGDFPEDADEDLMREIIWRDFVSGCAHITYPDGYLVDDLYELWENG